MFNKSRLKLAREIRKISKANLAEKIELSSQTLTEWEKGKTVPKYENLCELAKILDFPVEFFNSEKEYKLSTDKISYRALTKMKSLDRDYTYSYAKLATDLEFWIDSQFNLPTCNLKICHGELPEEAARRIRKEWQITNPCIDDTIFLLEKNGIKVFSLMDKVDYIDAFSFWDEDKPFVLLTHQKSSEHSRFDAMHELGHLVLHKDNFYKNKDAEKEAHRFAAEILMPEEDLKQYADMVPSLSNFINLKERWKVSLKALIYRFFQLNYITEWVYRILNMEMNKRGYNNNEPDTIPWEESTVINSIFHLLKEENLSVQDISYATNIPPKDLNKLMFNKFSMSLIYGQSRKSEKSSAKLTLL